MMLGVVYLMVDKKPLKIGIYICMVCRGHMFEAKHPYLKTCFNLSSGCTPVIHEDMKMDISLDIMKAVADVIDDTERDIILRKMNKK